MSADTGKWLIVAGSLIVVLGLIIWLLGDHLRWLGHLPGDIHIEGEDYSFYFPIITMIIVSIVLSLLFTLLARLFGK